jgi:Lipid A core - O-antigen ligase and related enzymes
VAGWLIIAALVYAPWAYGCTTSGTIVKLNYILGMAMTCWFGSLLLGSEIDGDSVHPGRRRIAAVLPFIASAILVIGWWMVANARWIYDSDFWLFAGRRNFFPFAAGSVDGAISRAWMLRATLLIGVIFLVAELARNRVWLLRLWWTVTLAGGSIALLGLIQKATGAEMIFWQRSEVKVTTFFATYYYHGNAGSYLNLVLPPAIGLSVRVFTRRSASHLRTAALLPCLLLLVAVLANTSRMAQVVAALLFVALAFYFREAVFSLTRMTNMKTLLLTTAVLAFALVAIARVSHLDQPLTRWYELTSQVDRDARWQASRAALRAIADAGCFGFGPGTFRVFFPYYTAGLGRNIAGVWRFLHEDYLQTLLEWGWIGSASLAVLYFGGFVVGTRNLIRRSRLLKWSPRQRLFLPMILLALAGISVHASVDFPLQIASLQLYVAVYLGVCWGSSYWGEGKQSRGSRAMRDETRATSPT